ncbi:MAG: plastocyanin/azurin family copper-binding protein [Acidimicrobiia bacterium]
MRRPLLALATLALVLAGCGDDDDAATSAETTSTTEPGIAPSTESGDAEPAVVAASFTFEPASIEVSAGDTVTWRNEDGVGHTVTAGTPEEPGDAFAEELPAGGTAEVGFDEAGTFPYFCAIHPTMTGAVVVS